MPNPIKYSTGSETQSLKKGNFYIGTGDIGKGPSDVTGYYNGVTPQTGGYVIYMFKDGAPGNLSYHSAANDSELISFTSGLAGQTYTGVSQCFDYYAGQTDKVMVIQEFPSDYPLNYPNIVMPGLVLNLDAGITQSYPGSGTTWTDINGLGPNNNGTLTNGPTFNSDNGGSIVFDGVDDYVSRPNFIGNLTTFSVSHFIYLNGTQNTRTIFSNYGSGNNGWVTGIRDDQNNIFKFYLGNTVHLYSNTVLNNLTWYHAVVTYDNGSPKIYINGNLDASSSARLTLASSYLGNDIGRLGDGRQYFNGRISNITIYNRALSANEVLQNYNATKGRFGL